MRVTWVTCAAIVRQPDGNLTCDLASARYRLLLPLQHMDRRHSHTIVTIMGEETNEQALQGMQADVVIFSKSFSDANEALMNIAQQNGARCFFDVCDNHFDTPGAIGEHYRHMADMADQIVCNTHDMAEIIARHSKKPCTVIDDPYESVRREPRFAPEPGKLNLLWFGHPSNLNSLQACLTTLGGSAERRGMQLNVTLLTQIVPGLNEFAEQLTSAYSASLHVKVEPWSLPRQWELLAACDAVIIPTLATERTLTKSANRMVESLNCGRAVLAGTLPAYEQFSPWVWIGEDFGEGLDWLRMQHSKIPLLIGQAQRYISESFSPSVIAARWEQLIEGAVH